MRLWPQTLVVGVDEAGRGPLAGPVVAAAVLLDPAQPLAGINDSKKLSARARERLAPEIQRTALAWAVAEADGEEIDRLNILHATLAAMRRAIDCVMLNLSQQGLVAQQIRVDGNRLPPGLPWPALAVVGGDAQEVAIAAASILAKTHRDALMCQLDLAYPQYGFARHMGYPTAAHLAALRTHGPCPAHRRSFAPVAQFLAPSLKQTALF